MAMKNDIKKLYNKLELLLKISIMSGEEYPSICIHRNDIKVLMKILKDYLEEEKK